MPGIRLAAPARATIAPRDTAPESGESARRGPRCACASRPPGTRPRSSCSCGGTGQWYWPRAGGCSGTPKTPRTRSRPRSWCWPARPLRSGAAPRSRPGCTASRCGSPDAPPVGAGPRPFLPPSRPRDPCPMPRSAPNSAACWTLRSTGSRSRTAGPSCCATSKAYRMPTRRGYSGARWGQSNRGSRPHGVRSETAWRGAAHSRRAFSRLLGCNPDLSAGTVATLTRAGVTVAEHGLRGRRSELVHEPGRRAGRTRECGPATKTIRTWVAVVLGVSLVGLAAGVGWANRPDDPPAEPAFVAEPPAPVAPAKPADKPAAKGEAWPLAKQFDLGIDGTLFGVAAGRQIRGSCCTRMRGLSGSRSRTKTRGDYARSQERCAGSRDAPRTGLSRRNSRGRERYEAPRHSRPGRRSALAPRRPAHRGRRVHGRRNEAGRPVCASRRDESARRCEDHQSHPRVGVGRGHAQGDRPPLSGRTRSRRASFHSTESSPGTDGSF